MNRRDALRVMAATPVLAMCRSGVEPTRGNIVKEGTVLTPDVIKSAEPLGFQWRTLDPFLFCVHHDDTYPKGNSSFGPAVPLSGRNIGSDFVVKDGFRMYHGDVVPGFPQHPHRGFETVTVVRRGLVDHSDSLGAAARYGHGDVQWLTAGGGIVHAEMFPCLDRDAPNPLELFQIWMNLPSTDKLVAPYFAMLWNTAIPRTTVLDTSGKKTELAIIAGKYSALVAPSPPPSSWAARSTSDIAIWTLKMEPGAHFTLPGGAAGSNRMLYYFSGENLRVAGRLVPGETGLELRADADVVLENGPRESELLLLHGRPIGEPVVQYGPFVMNTRAEIEKAYADYRRTGFGGWPWPKNDPVHDRDARFARRADGRVEIGG